ncbi:MAG TPA: hypothetical protein VHK69_19025, partial [Chitinophagaceae bacterium]|nr:hypothetical protein [Chitinophagaceae bacterium]
EFLGQEYINGSLHRMGYGSAQILHRLSLPLTEEENRHTNPVRFLDTAGNLLYRKEGERSTFRYAVRNDRMGKGYFTGKGVLVNEPFDFSAKNRLSLSDLHGMIRALLFPESVPEQNRFRLREDDYRFLRKYMSLSPQSSDDPKYDTAYGDAYAKFLLYGARGPVDTSIRIFNKIGNAYGFLTDAAYITDCSSGVEFLLSATIHVNPDGIYNDNRYAYDSVGYPFLKRLGEVILDYERNRPRKNPPRLPGINCLYNR